MTTRRTTLWCIIICISISIFIHWCARPSILHREWSGLQQSDVMVFELPNNVRQLRFGGGARQSEIQVGNPDYVDMNYLRGVMIGLALLEAPPQHTLVFGLGGASIPRFVRAHYPLGTVDVVEMDSTVVAVAKKYFDVPVDERLRIHIGDGSQELGKCVAAYEASARQATESTSNDFCAAEFDLIVQDACAGAPCGLVTISAYRSMAKLLSRNGLFIQNLYGAQGPVLQNIRAVFDQVYVIDCPPNVMVLATHRGAYITAAEFMDRARVFGVFEKLQFDYVSVAARFAPVRSVPISASPYREDH